MTYPQQQNMCFPDTIAVCLDEDKSVVNEIIDFDCSLVVFFFL
jgi:hypothetical protein